MSIRVIGEVSHHGHYGKRHGRSSKSYSKSYSRSRHSYGY
jgi:hypothetical protein